MEKIFLIVIDAHCKWLDVLMVPNTSTVVTTDALNSVFATHGIPSTLVSDNGASFTSDEFQQFCKASRIKHIRSAATHPATNGLAERAVQIFKNSMKKMRNNIPWKQGINRFLFKYRTTPQSTREDPAQLLMNRSLRTPLSQIQADLRGKVEKQATQCASHDKRARSCSFEPGDDMFTHHGGLV